MTDDAAATSPARASPRSTTTHTCSPPAENSVKTLGPFSLTIAAALNRV
jgi:hypothetical protein